MNLYFFHSISMRRFERFNHLLLILDCFCKLKYSFLIHLPLLIHFTVLSIFELNNQRFELLSYLLEKFVLVLLSSFNSSQPFLCCLNFFIALNNSDQKLICCILYFNFELFSVFFGQISYFLAEPRHSLVHHLFSIESQYSLNLVFSVFPYLFIQFF